MRVIILVLTLLVTACGIKEDKNHYVIKVGADETSYLKDIDACPKVHIKRNDGILVQKEGKVKAFEIIASGYSGHCYFNETINKTRAIIKPKFKILRLSDVDVSKVQFAYYLETAEGPEAYLGKKTYFAEVTIPQGTNQIEYIADSIEMTIPEERIKDADVYFGLNEDVYDLQFRK